MSIAIVRDYLVDLQQRITSTMAEVDGQAFMADKWKKSKHEPLQGTGVTQILENGAVFERAEIGRASCRERVLMPV